MTKKKISKKKVDKKKAAKKSPTKKRTDKNKTASFDDGRVVLEHEDMIELDRARLSTELAKTELQNLVYKNDEWERTHLVNKTDAKKRLVICIDRQSRIAKSLGEKYGVDMDAHGYDDVTGALTPIG